MFHLKKTPPSKVSIPNYRPKFLLYKPSEKWLNPPSPRGDANYVFTTWNYQLHLENMQKI